MVLGLSDCFYEILNCDHCWEFLISKSSWKKKHNDKLNTRKKIAHSELKRLVLKTKKTTLITINRKLAKASRVFKSSSQAVTTNLEQCSSTTNRNSVLFLKCSQQKCFDKTFKTLNSIKVDQNPSIFTSSMRYQRRI